MDAWLQLLGGLAGIALVAAIGSWFVSAGSNVIGGLVVPWREPGWPKGVQEDDDVRWRWHAHPASEEQVASQPDVQPLEAHLGWRGR